MSYSPVSQKKYNQDKCKFYGLKLHKVNDKAMIEHIEKAKADNSMQAYFKMLIERDMGGSQNE